MEESSFIEKLLLFGLGRQEAVIYLCLLKNEQLTGYEVSKLTGISRSNVYNGLAALVEHGAAYVCEGPSTRYVAVALSEFCDNRIRFLKKEQELLVANSPKKVAETEGYITVEGYSHICDKLHHMLLGAQRRIYFSAERSFLALWKEELGLAVQNGKKVVLITRDADTLFAEEPQLRKGILLYEAYQTPARFVDENMEPVEEQPKAADARCEAAKEASENGQNTHGSQIRLIIDSEYVLTGEIARTAQDTCLYSAQKNFVAVFKDAMRNEIELSRLKA